MIYSLFLTTPFYLSTIMNLTWLIPTSNLQPPASNLQNNLILYFKNPVVLYLSSQNPIIYWYICVFKKKLGDIWQLFVKAFLKTMR